MHPDVIGQTKSKMIRSINDRILDRRMSHASEWEREVQTDEKCLCKTLDRTDGLVIDPNVIDRKNPKMICSINDKEWMSHVFKCQISNKSKTDTYD